MPPFSRLRHIMSVIETQDMRCRSRRPAPPPVCARVRTRRIVRRAAASQTAASRDQNTHQQHVFDSKDT
eukprot:7369849-Prymnesium_polylepis.1